MKNRGLGGVDVLGGVVAQRATRKAHHAAQVVVNGDDDAAPEQVVGAPVLGPREPSGLHVALFHAFFAQVLEQVAPAPSTYFQ